MKKLSLLFVSAMAVLTAQAQLNGDGYYRAQNVTTGRYIRIVDDKGWVDFTSQTADLEAIKTVKPFDPTVVGDPGTVVYIKKMTQGYNLLSQGVSSYDIVQYQLRLYDNGDNTYSVYAAEKGMTKWLNDEYSSADVGQVGFNDDRYRLRDWYITPVKSDGSNYFGFTPSINVGDSYYQTFYAEFPIKLVSSGLKAYYATAVDTSYGVVVVEEVASSYLPGATPLIIKCASAESTNNRVDIITSSPSKLSNNILEGVYFSNKAENHDNYKVYNSKTMRVLGKLRDGSIGFIKGDFTMMPANSAWITVPESAPAELRLMERAEYEAEIAKEVIIRVKNATRDYGDENPTFSYTVEGEGELHGEPDLTTKATPTSTVGTYEITATRGSITNTNVTFIPGELTITKVPMHVSVQDTIRAYGSPNPDFVIEYAEEDWKNNETPAVFTSPVVATTTATITSPVGDYEIVLSGGESPNYEFSYTNGTLTVYYPNALTGIVANGQLFDVYNAYGVKVRSQVRSLNDLPRGLYIVNGKKVLKN